MNIDDKTIKLKSENEKYSISIAVGNTYAGIWVEGPEGCVALVSNLDYTAAGTYNKDEGNYKGIMNCVAEHKGKGMLQLSGEGINDVVQLTLDEVKELKEFLRERREVEKLIKESEVVASQEGDGESVQTP